MILKGNKEIYSAVSERLGMDVGTVQSVGSFIWSDIVYRVENFENRELYVLGLGTFKFRKKKGESYYEKMVEEYLPSTLPNLKINFIDEENVIVRLIDKLSRIEKLLVEWNEILEHRERFYFAKYGSKHLERRVSKQSRNLEWFKKQTIPPGTRRGSILSSHNYM